MTSTKQAIRPIIHAIGSQENASKEERFQNEVLRPIIKMQHDLIMAFFNNYLVKMKLQLEGLSDFQKKETVSNTFSKNQQFKTELRGMIVGQFTVEEYQEYVPISSTLNKRVSNMLQERIISTL